MAAYIRRCALVLLGLAVLPVQASMELGSDTQRAEGRELYDKYCAQCHGIEGDAEAYATTRVKPAPRDFTTGKFKFRTTPTGMLPTDQDLVNVIRDAPGDGPISLQPAHDETQIVMVRTAGAGSGEQQEKA